MHATSRCQTPQVRTTLWSSDGCRSLVAEELVGSPPESVNRVRQCYPISTAPVSWQTPHAGTRDLPDCEASESATASGADGKMQTRSYPRETRMRKMAARLGLSPMTFGCRTDEPLEATSPLIPQIYPSCGHSETHAPGADLCDGPWQVATQKPALVPESGFVAYKSERRSHLDSPSGQDVGSMYRKVASRPDDRQKTRTVPTEGQPEPKLQKSQCDHPLE
ncbi:hypothetical protein CMUS01_05427 [Colletotrichum musicola]|uniref:Uncharacterized protein n=1 Tax=Colletotrichum musicola TaxID=2175873 RepID=A0A8H6KRT0_9PEZI|nr:hypothetical protein CMUS01_05427 [Colletotrichum musicola]